MIKRILKWWSNFRFDPIEFGSEISPPPIGRDYVAAKEKPWVVEYPLLKTIDMSDLEVQQDLINKGFAVGVAGVHIEFIRSVELVAGRKGA